MQEGSQTKRRRKSELGTEASTAIGAEAAGSKDPLSMRQLASPAELASEDNDRGMLSEMYIWMLQSEEGFHPNPDYMNDIPQLAPNMRSILFDWMMEVCQEFSLGRETMHLAINFVDRFLSLCADKGPAQPGQKTTLHTNTVDRSNLQLLGVTCLFIASKLEEIYPPNGADFANTTADTFTVASIDSMERLILKGLEWKLQSQTPFSWLKMYIKLAGLPETTAGLEGLREGMFCTRNFNRMMELIDLATLDIRFSQIFPSMLAACALLIVVPQAVQIIAKVIPYKVEDLQAPILLLSQCDQFPHRARAVAWKHYADLKIPPEDLYTRQMHHDGAMDFVRAFGANTAHLDPRPSLAPRTLPAHLIVAAPMHTIFGSKVIRSA